MKRLSTLGALVLVVSCFGFDERLDACRRNEAMCAVTDAGAVTDGGTDAGCLPFAGDLLFNGSFERATDAGIPGWTSIAPLIHHATGGAHCEAWVEQSVASMTPMQLDGDFDLSAAAPMGTRFRITGWAKALDQNPTPLTIQLRVRSGGYLPTDTQRIDGNWTPVSVELDLIEMGRQLSVEVLTKGPRSIGLDGFSVVQLP